jgi:hypothetical protein
MQPILAVERAASSARPRTGTIWRGHRLRLAGRIGAPIEDVLGAAPEG